MLTHARRPHQDDAGGFPKPHVEEQVGVLLSWNCPWTVVLWENHIMAMVKWTRLSDVHGD